MQSIQATLLSGLSVVASASPALAARVSENLMFRTRRRTEPEHERELLARAEELRVQTRHGQLPVWRWGNGPSVLLVHGWNGRGAQLGSLVQPLVESGYQVVAFDAPGHGRAPGSRSSMVHFADAIEAVTETVRPFFGPVHAVIAHSMGGPATVLAMSRFQQRGPLALERGLWATELPVRRFVLIAPPTDIGDFVHAFARMTALGARTEALLRARIERRFGITIDELYAPTLARELAAPALVIHDADDREVPITRGRVLAQAWPGAELVETRGLGHVRILRDSAIIGRIVAFIDRRDHDIAA